MKLSEIPLSAVDKRKVVHYGESCTVHYSRYAHDPGALAIYLMTEEGEPMSTATVNCDETAALARQDKVAIKTWSENEGLLELLVAANIIVDTGARIRIGHGTGAVCTVTPQL